MRSEVTGRESLCVPSFAGTQKLETMASGQKVLEVASIKQVTSGNKSKTQSASISPDGKYVVYILDPSKLCLVDSSGEKSVVLFDMQRYISGEVDWAEKDTKSPWIPETEIISWSPDSKHFAVMATQISYSETDLNMNRGLLVMSLDGEIQCVLPPEGSNQLIFGPILWSRDGNKIVAQTSDLESASDPTAESSYALQVFDLQNKTMQIIARDEPDYFNLIGWGTSENSVYISLHNSSSKESELRAINLGDGTETLVRNVPRGQSFWSGCISPDGKFIAVSSSGGIQIETFGTWEAVRTVKKDAQFISWVPQNMLTYSRYEIIMGEDESRQKRLTTTWLASLDANQFNHMLLTIDVEQPPTWSADGLKTAFIRDGEVYVAKLDWREPDAAEKINIGASIPEQEVKSLLLGQGFDIGRMFYTYVSRSGGEFPTEEDLRHAARYHDSEDVFCCPGTDQNIFTYFPRAKFTDIEKPEEVIIGELDAGYSWKVVINAAGASIPEEK